MLKKPWEGYLRTNDIIEEIPGQFILSEIDNNRQWSMHLNVTINSSSSFYRLFHKDQKKERSRITFGHLENFPDAIILEKLSDDTLKFHIFELKKRPTNGNNIEKISKQFISGYMHTKLIRSFVADRYLSSVTYKYYVVYTDEVPRKLGFDKVIPGNPTFNQTVTDDSQTENTDPIKKIKKDRVLREWKRDKIIFRSLTPDSYYVFNNVVKIVLKRVSNKANIKLFSYEENLHI